MANLILPPHLQPLKKSGVCPTCGRMDEPEKEQDVLELTLEEAYEQIQNAKEAAHDWTQKARKLDPKKTQKYSDEEMHAVYYHTLNLDVEWMLKIEAEYNLKHRLARPTPDFSLNSGTYTFSVKDD